MCINRHVFSCCTLSFYSGQVFPFRKNGMCRSFVALSIIFQKKLEDVNTNRLQKQAQLRQLMFKEMKRKPPVFVSVTTGHFLIQSNKIFHMDGNCQSPKVGAHCLCSLCTRWVAQPSAVLLQQLSFVTLHWGLSKRSKQSHRKAFKEEYIFSSLFGSCD